MKVPFFKPSINIEEIDAVNCVLKSGWLTTGPETQLFEQEFADFVGSKFAIAVNSCTAALHLALKVINVQRGDLVLVPTFTFAATAEVVTYFGAIPIFIDSDPRDFCMDPIEVERQINKLSSERIKAIIPVHVAGQVGSLSEILALGAKYNIPIIEDSAHTLPAYWREFANKPWKHAGTGGLLGCFSFYPNKPITTGEGGMVVTDNEELALRIKKLSLHGLDTNAWDRFNSNTLTTDIKEPGFKYNLTDIASSMGRVQLKRIKDLWAARKKVVLTYNEQLRDIEELELPTERVDRLHSWCLYIIKLKSLNRDHLIQELRDNNIYATVHWRPLHLQTYYKYKYVHWNREQFPVATNFGERVFSLPLYADMSEEQVDFVVSTLRKIIKT